MNTPSKEALEAAFDLFKHRYCYGSDNDNAAIIDRHFEPLRQRAERAEARVKEYEAQLSAVMPADFKDWHQNSRSEWPVVTASVIRNLQARVKELEATCAELVTDADAVTLAANLARQSKRVKELETLLASEKATRNAIIAKGIAMERANAELANKLENCMDMLEELEDCDWGDCGMPFTIDWDSLRAVLARHSAGEPEAQK